MLEETCAAQQPLEWPASKSRVLLIHSLLPVHSGMLTRGAAYRTSARKVLTQMLRGMVDDGFVERRVLK